MAGMFPTIVGGANDPNRRYDVPAGETWPAPLRLAFRLLVIAAVLMLLSGMMMLAGGFPDGADEAFRDVFMLNMRFAAVGDILLGLGIGGCAAYLERGSRAARRWAAVLAAAGIFLNIAAFALKVSSWASFVIVLILAVAAWFMFRPASNAYIDVKHSLWRGVE
ncbi:hypothetical protein [Corynebacterium sp. UBA2622]|uniref:hypothetical protein n=1 Tax=Corynebacterium sp. UBA2622 TaxID=1946393 RepID=UPI0025BBFA9C|nr:hypothetical protein [Corynebacterium sp. UBA2622]